MVQGKNFENCTLNIFNPYFSKKIEESGDHIVKFNTNVKNALGKQNTSDKNKK